MPLRFYHGTSAVAGATLANGAIRVAVGGGELGRGFYTTDRLYVAKAWAYQKHRSTAVLEVAAPEIAFWALDIKAFDSQQASTYRARIRNDGTSRTFRFHCDVVWAPIVGTARNGLSDQYKWESNLSERFLNSVQCTRRIV